MTIFVPITLWGFIPFVLMLYAVLPPRRAMITAILAGWLFLPMSGYTFSGLPEYTKVSAISFGILLGAAMFDSRRLLDFRPSWFDLPILVWCLCPIVSSIINQIVGNNLLMSLYGGLTITFDHLVMWGIPYLIGRIYFRTFDHLRELAIAIFVAGLVYVPFCLIEIRMSPQLHKFVYGFYQHAFSSTNRLGGYRPMVFMQHGIMLGMFMTSASLIGIWFWVSGAVKRLWGMPIGWLVALLLLTTVLCKSVAALALLVLGIGVLVAVKWTAGRAAMVVLVVLAPLYMTFRGSGGWSGETLVELAEVLVNEDRARSLAGRMANEDLFREKSMQRPFFGWSGWNRFQVYDDWGRLLTTPDGLWVIALGKFGLVGLISVTSLLLLPAVVLIYRHPKRTWPSPRLGPTVALTTCQVLLMLDCLLNAMVGPAYIVVAGALMTVLPQFKPAAVGAPHPGMRPVVSPTRHRPELR